MSSPSSNLFVEFINRYKAHPELCCREVFGFTPDPWQREEMEAIAQGHRRVSIRSGHGVGKSTFAASTMLWFFMTRFPVKVVVTAPTSAQLFDALFAELKGLVNRLSPAWQQLLTVKQDRIELKAAPDEAFISARTSRAETPEALQGVHSANVMLVADEASGVPDLVFEAAGGSMSGENAHTILLGNPTRGSGLFYMTHTSLSGTWRTRRVSCLDSPRVSAEYVQEQKDKYGEDSNAYRVRVLGEFPRSDDDTVISLDLAESAMGRDVVSEAPEVWGLDVARFGGDRTALAKRRGTIVTSVRTWKNLDLMQTTGAIVAEYRTAEKRPTVILVDSIGLGGGVVDRLRELELPVRGINVSEVPSVAGTYMNLRTELWFKMKGWLEARDCRLPRDEELVHELTTPRFSFTSSGKLKVEGKDDMKRRGLPSPDKADAVCLTMATDAATLLTGRFSSWNSPIRRNLKGVA